MDKADGYRLLMYGALNVQPLAGLAQLVERQLPKLNVASSNLVPRSIFRGECIVHFAACDSNTNIVRK